MSFRSHPRDLWLVAGARGISLLGDEAAVIALTLRLHDSGGGPGAISALLIAGFLPLVLLAPLVGAAVDRFDSRRLLVGSSLAQAVLCLVLVQVHSTAAVLGLVAALGAGQAVNSATWQALIPSIVAPETLPAALGLSQLFTTTAGIVAPAVGGLLTVRYGSRVPLLLDAATFLAITVAALLVQVRRGGTPRADRERAHGGFTLVRRDPVLARLFAMLAVFITLGAMVNVVEIFLIRDTLHASATWYGAVAALWSTGLLAGAVLGGRLRGQLALVRVLLGSAAGLSLALIGYAAAGTIGVLVPLALVGGFANGLLNLTNSALVPARAPESARGRVAATVGAIASASLVGAYLLGGLLAEQVTPRTIFLASGVLGLLGPALFGRALLRVAKSSPAALLPSRDALIRSEA